MNKIFRHPGNGHGGGMAPEASAVPLPLTLEPLPTFRITATQLGQLEQEHHGISKLILQPGFANLNEPTTLDLYLYPALSHRQYGRNTTPAAMARETGEYSYNLPGQMVIGNCEIDFKELRNVLKRGNDWSESAYLALKPKVKNVMGMPYLGFDIEFRNLEEEVEEDLGRGDTALTETHPSPPAPPYEGETVES